MEHEDRALFYKRFLLLLWGAHERTDVFGSLPKGMNWLTQETHRSAFEFVHDEEMGLPDGRLPVREWIAQNNRNIRPGSMVVATWKRLINDISAPGAWSNHVHHAQEQVKEAARTADVVQVQRRGDDMVLTAECVRRFDFHGKITNVKVAISDASKSPFVTEPDGLICIDHMKSADVVAYIDSRQHRASYLHWLGQSMLALPHILEREVMEAELTARLQAGLRPSDSACIAHLPDVAHEAVLAAGWALPKESMDPKLIAMARVLARERISHPDRALQVCLRPGGEIAALFAADPLLGGDVPEPFLMQRIYAPKQGGPLQVKSERIVPFSGIPAAGEIVLRSDMPRAMVDAAWKRAEGGISTVADRDFVAGLIGGTVSQDIHDLLDHLENPKSADIQDLLDTIYEAHRGRSKIMDMNVWTPAGVFTMPSDGAPVLGIVGVEHHAVYHAWRSGYRDLVEIFVNRLYENPQKQIDRFKGFESSGRSPIRLWSDVKGRRDPILDRLASFGADIRPDILTVKDITWHSQEDGDQRMPAPGTSIRDMLRRNIIAPRITGYFGKVSRSKIDEAIAISERIVLRMPEGLEQRILGIMAKFEAGKDDPVFDI